MKNMKAFLLILDQWGLHDIKNHKFLKVIPMILDGRGLHEKHEDSSADFWVNVCFIKIN